MTTNVKKYLSTEAVSVFVDEKNIPAEEPAVDEFPDDEFLANVFFIDDLLADEFLDDAAAGDEPPDDEPTDEEPTDEEPTADAPLMAAKPIETFKNAAEDVDDLMESLKTKKRLATKTGFQTLDKILNGGLHVGLHVVGGISSLGKTTLVCQIADYIAKCGKDVLIVSLEMSKEELICKSLSRLTAGAVKNSKNTSMQPLSFFDIMYADFTAQPGEQLIIEGTDVPPSEQFVDKKCQLILDVVDTYKKDIAKHIYLFEAKGPISAAKIENIVQALTEQLNSASTDENDETLPLNAPVIIVDYLQILSSKRNNTSDKQAIDESILALKQLSRDFNTPVLVVSSLNRASYEMPIHMSSFKESGSIEYSADTLIGLQLEGVGTEEFDANLEKSKNPRSIEAVILKNRNGPSGGKVPLRFYTKHNYFEEKPEGLAF